MPLRHYHRKLDAGFVALPQMTGRRFGMPFILSPPTLTLRFRQNNGSTPSGDYQPSRSLSMAGSDGMISLVVPDKRYCFDHYRPITGLSKIIDSHYQKNKIHTPGTVAEYYLNVVSKAGTIAWDPSVTGTYACVHSLEDAFQGMTTVLNEKTYIDVHAWCFVPHSFRLMIHDLFCLGLTPLKEVGFFSTTDHLFYITLSRKGKGINRSRIEMLDSIGAEIKEGISISKKLDLPTKIRNSLT